MSRIVKLNQYNKDIIKNPWSQAQTALKIIKSFQNHELVTYHSIFNNSKTLINSLRKFGTFEVFSLNKSKFWPTHPAFQWIAKGRIFVIIWKKYIENDSLWELMQKSAIFACSFSGFFVNINKYDLKYFCQISKENKSGVVSPMLHLFLQSIYQCVAILFHFIIKFIQLLFILQGKKL